MQGHAKRCSYVFVYRYQPVNARFLCVIARLLNAMLLKHGAMERSV
jgi:hypothetical protein